MSEMHATESATSAETSHSSTAAQKEQPQRNPTKSISSLSDKSTKTSLLDALFEQKEWSKAIIFDQKTNILAATCKVREEELPPILKLYHKREDAISSGIIFMQEQYDIHRYHPPLIYGRRGDPLLETSEGIAICKIEQSPPKMNVYCLITYTYPTLSARAVPQLQSFCESIGT